MTLADRWHPPPSQELSTPEGRILRYCMYGPDDGSELRARVMASFDRFIEIGNKSDREVADLMKSMEIDIAEIFFRDAMPRRGGQRVICAATFRASMAIWRRRPVATLRYPTK